MRQNSTGVHTRSMTLKSSAFLALLAMALLTVVYVADFIRDVSALMGGLIPVMTFFRSMIYLFMGLAVTVFFYVFYRAQSR